MMEQQAFEAWAITRAHEIMMREGLQLALSAQNLDRKKVKSDSYRLRQAITDCLLEVRGAVFLGGREEAAEWLGENQAIVTS